MAVFVAPYTAVSTVYAQRADGDEKLTMAPPSRSAAPTSRDRNQTDSRLTATTLWKSASVTSQIGLSPRMPAAFTR